MRAEAEILLELARNTAMIVVTLPLLDEFAGLGGTLEWNIEFLSKGFNITIIA